MADRGDRDATQRGATGPLPSGVSVVIPVFNSAETLGELVARIEQVLTGIDEAFELILVDDDSRDNSWDVISRITAERSWVASIRLMRNYGQHNALLCGIRRARYDLTVTLDDDLQNAPEEIPRLIAKLKEGCDVVYGTPLQKQHGFLRGVATSLTKLALRGAMGGKMARLVSPFRVFRTALRAAFDGYRGPYVSIDVLLTWGTTRFAAVRVPHQPRSAGASNYTLSRLVGHALNMLTGFSSLPLQLASVMGFVFTLFGVAVLAYVVGRYFLQGSTVPGFPFLASVIAIFSGVQLFVLGIMGEYLARVHFRMMERPTYVVRADVGTEAGRETDCGQENGGR